MYVVLPAPGCSLLRQATSATQTTEYSAMPPLQLCYPAPLSAVRARLQMQALALPVSTDAGATAGGWRLYGGGSSWLTFRGLIESDYCCSSSCFSTRKPELSMLILLLLLLSPLLYAIACYCTLPPTVHGGSGPHVLSWPRCPWWSRPLHVPKAMRILLPTLFDLPPSRGAT